ncbi:MAG: hypothetical protein MJZ30_09440 [Paludibacteraceae bacterium]|nr:hypothetical protein [Paludibacteraceae bacterium]
MMVRYDYDDIFSSNGVGETDWAGVIDTVVKTGSQMYSSYQEAKTANDQATAKKAANELALEEAKRQRDEAAIRAAQERIAAANKTIEAAQMAMDKYEQQNKAANTALYITLGVAGVTVLGLLGYVLLKK